MGSGYGSDIAAAVAAAAAAPAGIVFAGLANLADRERKAGTSFVDLHVGDAAQTDRWKKMGTNWFLVAELHMKMALQMFLAEQNKNPHNLAIYCEELCGLCVSVLDLAPGLLRTAVPQTKLSQLSEEGLWECHPSMQGAREPGNS